MSVYMEYDMLFGTLLFLFQIFLFLSFLQAKGYNFLDILLAYYFLTAVLFLIFSNH